MVWLGIFLIKRDLFVAPVKLLEYLLIIQQEEPSEVTRTGVWVIAVNFSEILIKVKEIQFELAGISSNLSSSFRGFAVIKSWLSIRTVVINIIIYDLGWRTLSLRMPKL